MRLLRLCFLPVLLMTACQPVLPMPGGSGTVSVQVTNPVKPALLKAYAQAAGVFRTQSMDIGDILQANVTVSGVGIPSPISVAGNPVPIFNGQGQSAAQALVPVGTNRIVTASGLTVGGTPLPGWLAVKAVTDVGTGSNPPVVVSWRTTPTAGVIEALMAANSPYAATVNAAQLQGLIDQITVPAVTGGSTTYTVHPSLVDTSALAAAIVTNGGAVPAAPSPAFRRSPGTITGTVGGMVTLPTSRPWTQAATVVANDPASDAVATTPAGAYTITGVAPGSGVTVTATQPYYDTATTAVNVSVGGTATANLAVNSLNYITRSLPIAPNTWTPVYRFTRMPIRVLLVEPANGASIGWTADHEQAVRDAADSWVAQLGDIMSFDVTTALDNDPQVATKKAAADISVDWVHNLSGTVLGVTNPGTFSWCGTCAPPYATDWSARITLSTTTSSGTTLSDMVLRAIAIHEFGHALGSWGAGDPANNTGHSPNVADIMYPTMPLTNPIYLMPSIQDYKTMRFIYSLGADITRLP